MSTPLSAANARFALSLYQQLTTADESDDNIFLSPLSIFICSAMLYLGSRGSTRSQLGDALHFPSLDEKTLHHQFQQLLTGLQTGSRLRQAFQHLVYRLQPGFSCSSSSFCRRQWYSGHHVRLARRRSTFDSSTGRKRFAVKP